MRKAVVLMNLGGPLCKEDIPPFLFNFFMDKNIITAPLPVRYLLAKWISFKRSRNEAHSAYKELGYKSPLLENTQAQAAALQSVLGEGYQVFVSMRYWHPKAEKVVQDVLDYNPDEVILLPLYPQFSTTTVRSSFQDWYKAAKTAGLNKPTQEICCYPEDHGFIQASVGSIKQALKNMPDNTRVLFSAHGLPEKIIASGDPYQSQCERTAKTIVNALNIENLDWEICYQSRVGHLKWIGPSTKEAIEKAAKDKKAILVYPQAFVSEHVETLVEIDIEYRELAENLGVSKFTRAKAVGTDPQFIAGLASLVANEDCGKICPAKFVRCHGSKAKAA